MTEPRADAPHGLGVESSGQYHYSGDAIADASADLLRQVLEAVCEQRGVSLDSSADPGTPARNYELMDRLGVGHIVGIYSVATTALCRHHNAETGDLCQRERGHAGPHAAWADPDQPPYRKWER